MLWLPSPGAVHCSLKSAQKFHILKRKQNGFEPVRNVNDQEIPKLLTEKTAKIQRGQQKFARHFLRNILNKNKEITLSLNIYPLVLVLDFFLAFEYIIKQLLNSVFV